MQEGRRNKSCNWKRGAPCKMAAVTGVTRTLYARCPMFMIKRRGGRVVETLHLRYRDFWFKSRTRQQPFSSSLCYRDCGLCVSSISAKLNTKMNEQTKRQKGAYEVPCEANASWLIGFNVLSTALGHLRTIKLRKTRIHISKLSS